VLKKRKRTIEEEVRVCDLCPEDRAPEASYSCFMCGRDLCSAHAICFVVPLRWASCCPERAYADAAPVPFGSVTLHLCPECLGTTSLGAFLEKLSKEGLEVETGRVVSARLAPVPTAD